jgi:uncharacterized membrane protein
MERKNGAEEEKGESGGGGGLLVLGLFLVLGFLLVSDLLGEDGGGLGGVSIRDLNEVDIVTGLQVGLVADKVTSSLQLNTLALLQQAQVGVSNCVSLKQRKKKKELRTTTPTTHFFSFLPQIWSWD